MAVAVNLSQLARQVSAMNLSEEVVPENILEATGEMSLEDILIQLPTLSDDNEFIGGLLILRAAYVRKGQIGHLRFCQELHTILWTLPTEREGCGQLAFIKARLWIIQWLFKKWRVWAVDSEGASQEESVLDFVVNVLNDNPNQTPDGYPACVAAMRGNVVRHFSDWVQGLTVAMNRQDVIILLMNWQLRSLPSDVKQVIKYHLEFVEGISLAAKTRELFRGEQI